MYKILKVKAELFSSRNHGQMWNLCLHIFSVLRHVVFCMSLKKENKSVVSPLIKKINR